jgi:hypothetical protein
MNQSVIVVALTPFLIFAVQCILNRILRPLLSSQFIAVVSCLTGFSIVTGSSIVMETNIAFAAVNALLLAHFYFHLFNMSETARRIKIVRLFYRNEDAGAVLGNYSPEELVEQRIERLLILRQVRSVEGKILPHGKLLILVARVMIAYERLLFPRRLDLRVSPDTLEAGEVDRKLRNALKVTK